MGFRVLLAALLLVAAPAYALVKAGPNVLGAHHRLKTPGASGPPFGSASGLYSFRKIGPGFGGNAIRLRRTSDNAQQDIGFVGNDFNTAAATTFCNATTCYAAVWYDQAPAAQNFTQPSNSAASQPALQFSCIGSLPCLMFTTTQSMAAPSVSQTGVVTLNVVANRSVGTGICVLPQVSNNAIKTRSGVAGFVLQGGVGSINISPAENVWHSLTGIINAATSSFAADGATTTGSLTGSVGSAGPSIQGATTTTCLFTEIGFWQAYAMPAAEVAALNTDQHAYWGF